MYDVHSIRSLILTTVGTITVTILVVGCEFKDPNEGFDPDWEPDHPEAMDESLGSEIDSAVDSERASNDVGDDRAAKRPSDIAADTNGMTSESHTWTELDGAIESAFDVYRDRGDIAMIVERTDRITRSFYFDHGALFYFTESDLSDGTEFVVEFDEIGDVRGARKNRGSQRVDVSDREISEIVEHASELLIAAMEQAEDHAARANGQGAGGS